MTKLYVSDRAAYVFPIDRNFRTGENAHEAGQRLDCEPFTDLHLRGSGCGRAGGIVFGGRSAAVSDRDGGVRRCAGGRDIDRLEDAVTLTTWSISHNMDEVCR